MIDTLPRLRRAYRQQQEAYEEVLRLAREGARRVYAGEPLPRLQEVNLRKRECLARVEQIEREIAEDKHAWHAAQPRGPEARELHAMLQQLTDLIEQILDCERETDRWILRGAGGEPTRELDPDADRATS